MNLGRLERSELESGSGRLTLGGGLDTTGVGAAGVVVVGFSGEIFGVGVTSTFSIVSDFWGTFGVALSVFTSTASGFATVIAVGVVTGAGVDSVATDSAAGVVSLDGAGVTEGVSEGVAAGVAATGDSEAIGSDFTGTKPVSVGWLAVVSLDRVAVGSGVVVETGVVFVAVTCSCCSEGTGDGTEGVFRSSKIAASCIEESPP